MAKKPKDQKRTHKTEVNAWAMVRDVLVQSMNRGQLLPAAVSLFLIILAAKMPSEDAGTLLSKIFEKVVDGSLVGWILFLVAVVGGAQVFRAQRRAWGKEMERVTKERNRYQQKVLGEDLGSSD